jgi:hypothetical protein
MVKEKLITSYIDSQINKVFEKIEYDLKGKSAEFLFQEHFTDRVIKERNKRKQFMSFQKFYFETLRSIDSIDFKEFKQMYSLQGVDTDYLEKLNENKEVISGLIDEGNLSKLYFDFFESAEIGTKNGNKKKTLGSFFTKLVHTLMPEEYTPVDIPMKNYFGFKKDSYFIAMIVISLAFKFWCDKNRKMVEEFKSLMCENLLKDYSIKISKDKVTDMKVMNTIFWSVANPIK